MPSIKQTFMRAVPIWRETTTSTWFKRRVSFCGTQLVAAIVIAPVAISSQSDRVLAQGASQVIPQNAHAKSYGSGWECDHGYRQREQKCAEVVVPANAYLTNSTFGRGWECNYGYREYLDNCSAVDVPDNGYINDSGTGWKCDRGFLRQDEGCTRIEVPTNGYPDPCDLFVRNACSGSFIATQSSPILSNFRLHFQPTS